MGLYPQPNKWQCGPFALKHGLIMLGRIVNEKEVSRIAGAHWWSGTDEIKLSNAAKAYDCELKMLRRKNALRARRELLLALKRGHPCILCVDNWNHWITVVGAERGKFIYIDSREEPVVCVAEWKSLKRRWIYREVDEDDPTQIETLFDLHTLVPKFRVKSKAHFSLKSARYLRRPENRTFATHWDEYFDDLSYVCHPRTPLSEKVFPMGELLRRHGTMIRSQVVFWHGSVKPKELDKILRDLQFVAATYDFVVRRDDEKRAIAAISTMLTLWASSKRGVGAVYGNR
ncbi:MAG TPA: hypothetical protein DGH68_10230 [Bacteroidetes bacterium]|nr:hypothetical protein [Bacteroidota bacterium]